jgi:hypothetical protein
MNKPPVQGPGLPFTISWHTMVQYDSESIFVIGGKQDGQTTPSNRTMIGKTIYLISFVSSCLFQVDTYFFSRNDSFLGN